MKKLFWFLILFSSAVSCDEPQKARTVSENTDSGDPLSNWSFRLEERPNVYEGDSIPPLAAVYFWRHNPVADSSSVIQKTESWTPGIGFDVYPLKDSVFCRSTSMTLTLLSSCSPPNTGGALYYVGNYIFLNRNVCVDCGSYKTGEDYCSSMLKNVFADIIVSKSSSVEELVGQFKIRREYFH